MNSERSLKRESFSILKGLAIFGIVISHLPRVLSLPKSIGEMLHPLGYLGVAVFLVLSGYGCTMSLISRGGGIQ